MDALTPRLSLEAVTRRFPGGAGVEAISFAVAPGEVVCLLGPSGCGKSTTLRLAAGIERADGGTIRIDGLTVQGPQRFVPPEDRRVGLMFQDYALFPHLTALGNVMFGLDRLERAQARAAALRALDHVGLAHLAQAYPHRLSGGEQQRVALARAMAPGPRLMLMDEPFSGLDRRLREDVRDMTMRVLGEAGASVLIVTHDPEEAMEIAGRIVLLRNGRVVQDAAPEIVYGQPADGQAASFFSPHVELSGVVANGRVATPLGPVPCTLGEGARVTVLIRPDAVLVAERGVPAVVNRVRMVGPEMILDLVTVGPEPLTLRARLRLDARPRTGETVNLALHPVRTLVIPA